FLHGVSSAGPISAASTGGSAGATARKDESLGVSAFCARHDPVCPPFYEGEYAVTRRPAPGQCANLVWPEPLPDRAHLATNASQCLRSYKQMLTERSDTMDHEHAEHEVTRL